MWTEDRIVLIKDKMIEDYRWEKVIRLNITNFQFYYLFVIIDHHLLLNVLYFQYKSKH